MRGRYKEMERERERERERWRERERDGKRERAEGETEGEYVWWLDVRLHSKYKRQRVPNKTVAQAADGGWRRL